MYIFNGSDELLKDQLATDGCSKLVLQFIVRSCKWNVRLVLFFALSRWEHNCIWFIHTFLFFWLMPKAAHKRAKCKKQNWAKLHHFHSPTQTYNVQTLSRTRSLLYWWADDWKRWASKLLLSSVLQQSVSTIRRNFYRVPFLARMHCAMSGTILGWKRCTPSAIIIK